MSDFTDQERATIYRLIGMRRDMRHFLPDPLDDALIRRLLGAAHLAPSVGLMQPWRFIRIMDRRLRGKIHALVEAERVLTAKALGEREECGEVMVAALAPGREVHVFGRRTMPDMDLASVSCAIQNLWLAARAENVGLGWVSLFDPEALRLLIHMPQGSRPVAVLCLGYVPEFYPRPMLEEAGWAERIDLDEFVHIDVWKEGGDP